MFEPCMQGRVSFVRKVHSYQVGAQRMDTHNNALIRGYRIEVCFPYTELSLLVLPYGGVCLAASDPTYSISLQALKSPRQTKTLDDRKNGLCVCHAQHCHLRCLQGTTLCNNENNNRRQRLCHLRSALHVLKYQVET